MCIGVVCIDKNIRRKYQAVFISYFGAYGIYLAGIRKGIRELHNDIQNPRAKKILVFILSE